MKPQKPEPNQDSPLRIRRVLPQAVFAGTQPQVHPPVLRVGPLQAALVHGPAPERQPGALSRRGDCVVCAQPLHTKGKCLFPEIGDPSRISAVRRIHHSRIRMWVHRSKPGALPRRSDCFVCAQPLHSKGEFLFR